MRLPAAESDAYRTALRTLVALSMVGAAWVAAKSARLILLGFAAILLAVFLRSLADPLARRTGLGERSAFFVVVAGLALLFAGLAWMLSTAVLSQMSDLVDRLPAAVERVIQWIRSSPLGAKLMDQAGRLDPAFLQRPALDRAGHLLAVSLAVLSGVGVTVALALFLAFDPRPYTYGFMRLFAPARQPALQALMDELATVLRQWMLGKLFAMSFIGVVTAIGLSLLGVQFALALGVIAGLLTFIPYLGPLLSFVPAFVFSFVESPHLAVWVGGFYVVLQLTESHLVTPIVDRRMVRVAPALVILSQLLFGWLFGFLGLMLASPIAAAGRVLIERLYVERVLHVPPD